MTHDVSIVIPTWNGQQLLERFLPSVVDAAETYRHAAGAEVEILVVDDGGSDNTGSWLESHDWAMVRLVRREENGGFSHACNTGFQSAVHDLILLLNNDVEVESGFIAPLVRRMEAPDVFAVAALTKDLETDEPTGVGKLGDFSRGFLRVHDGYLPDGRFSDDPICIFASGGAAMFSREKLQTLGGFDPLYSPFYWEDVELSYKAWKRGWRVLFEPDSRVRHQFSSTIGKRFPRRQVRAVMHRNRLLAHWVHLHDSTLWRRHLVYVATLVVAAPLRGDLAFLSGLRQALSLREQALERREREIAAAVRTDGEVLGMFRAFAARQDIRRV